LCYICHMFGTGSQSHTEASGKNELPLIIAHRGARREAPENTLPAIQRAIEIGSDGVEFDVLLTSDRVPVLGHNDDLSILTPHRGYVRATPFSAMRQMDVGSHFGPAFAGTNAPSLTDALELVSRHEILTIVEIKAQPGMVTQAAQIVVEIASRFKMRGPILLSSSNLRILHALARHRSTLPHALILRRHSFTFFPAKLFAKLLKLEALHPSLRVVNKRMVQAMHKQGCQVHAWTANEPRELDLCLSLGVDGIITDDPVFARQYLKRSARRRHG
jgi:glycerophosphoryl diester phosphodiesterase